MSDHLPLEIVEEILHRLPIKSLAKFTSVCKAWNSLITDQTFISDHLNRTIQASNGNSSLFFQFCLKKDKGQRHDHHEDLYSLYSNQQTEHFSVKRFPLSHLFRRDRYTLFAGTCNGLVCSADYSPLHSANIIIWNPLLRKYMVLPKPITTYKKRDRELCAKYELLFGFGFDSTKNDYKIVRLMNHLPTQDTPDVEVYSLLSRCWRSINVRVPQFYFSYYDLPPVFVNGAIHWLVYRRRCDGSSHKFILSFDVTKETFGELMLPQQSLSRQTVISRFVVGDGGHSLAVVNHCLIKCRRWMCSIWVMKEYGITESWTKIFHCDTRRYGGISDILALTSDGEVIIRLDIFGAVVLVDPFKNLVKPMGYQAYSEVYIGSYVESLFFMNKQDDVLSF